MSKQEQLCGNPQGGASIGARGAQSNRHRLGRHATYGHENEQTARTGRQIVNKE